MEKQTILARDIDGNLHVNCIFTVDQQKSTESKIILNYDSIKMVIDTEEKRIHVGRSHISYQSIPAGKGIVLNGKIVSYGDIGRSCCLDIRKMLEKPESISSLSESIESSLLIDTRLKITPVEMGDPSSFRHYARFARTSDETEEEKSTDAPVSLAKRIFVSMIFQAESGRELHLDKKFEEIKSAPKDIVVLYVPIPSEDIGKETVVRPDGLTYYSLSSFVASIYSRCVRSGELDEMGSETIRVLHSAIRSTGYPGAEFFYCVNEKGEVTCNII